MATIREVMSTTLLTVDATATVTEAAAQMDGRRVGAALVMNGERLSGILTERDILHAVATGQVEGTKVGAWMTHDPETVVATVTAPTRVIEPEVEEEELAEEEAEAAEGEAAEGEAPAEPEAEAAEEPGTTEG